MRGIGEDNYEAVKEGYRVGQLQLVDPNSPAYQQFYAAVNGQPVIPSLTREQQKRAYPGIRSVGQGGVPTSVETIRVTPESLLQGQLEAARGGSLGYVQSEQGEDLLAGKPFARFALENPVLAGRIGNFLTNGVTILAGAGETISMSSRTVLNPAEMARLTVIAPRQESLFFPLLSAVQTIRENNQELRGLRGEERQTFFTNRAETFVTDRATYESCNSGNGACAAWNAYNIINQAAQKPGATETTRAVAQQAASSYLLNLETQRQDATTIDVIAGVGSFFGGIASPNIGLDLLVGQIAGAGQTIFREIFIDTPQEALARAGRQYLWENRGQTDEATVNSLQQDSAATFWDGVARMFRNMEQQATVGGGIDVGLAGVGTVLGRGVRALAGTPTEVVEQVVVVPRTSVADYTPRTSGPLFGTQPAFTRGAARIGFIDNLADDFRRGLLEAESFVFPERDPFGGLLGGARRSDQLNAPGRIGGGMGETVKAITGRSGRTYDLQRTGSEGNFVVDVVDPQAGQLAGQYRVYTNDNYSQVLNQNPDLPPLPQEVETFYSRFDVFSQYQGDGLSTLMLQDVFTEMEKLGGRHIENFSTMGAERLLSRYMDQGYKPFIDPTTGQEFWYKDYFE